MSDLFSSAPKPEPTSPEYRQFVEDLAELPHDAFVNLYGVSKEVARKLSPAIAEQMVLSATMPRERLTPRDAATEYRADE